MSAQMPEDKYVVASGIKTRYWSVGDRGSPVILIHGFGASVEIWQHNVSALSNNHRVYALDLVGYGRSDKPSGKYSPSFLINHLNEFASALHIERASLVGLSMGGAVSLLYTLAYPEKVQKLVLVDSVGLGDKIIPLVRLMTLPILGEIMTRPSRMGTYLFFKPTVLDSKILKGAFTDLYYELFSLPGAQEAKLQTFRSICNIFGLRENFLHSTRSNLSRITAPTLIVWGEQDALLAVGQAHFALGKIPNAQIHICKQCGHMPNFEKPEEFNGVILDFLSG